MSKEIFEILCKAGVYDARSFFGRGKYWKRKRKGKASIRAVRKSKNRIVKASRKANR